MSPFTSLPRRLAWSATDRRRQRAANLLIFTVTPTALFWIWFGSSVVHRLPPELPSLRYAIPLAALWITCGPPLMQQGEFNLERLLDAFSRHGRDAGWDLGAMRRGLALADRMYYPLVLLLGLAAPLALILSFSGLAEVLPIENLMDRVAGVVVIASVGICSASGLWGVTKVMVLVRAATHHARLRWRPFHSERVWGMRQLYGFAWLEGMIFSVGTLFVPAMLAVLPTLSPFSVIIVCTFIVLLLLGGLALFSIPALLLHRVGQRHKEAALDALAPALEQAEHWAATVDQLPDRTAEPVSSQLDAVLRLRQAITVADPAPFSLGYLARASSTLVLPVLLTVLQIAAS